MTNNKVQIKLKQRCNKVDSKDYDNLECWVMQEAMNKAQLEWVRVQLHGGNIYKEGAEQSTRRVDDLEILLDNYPLKGTTKDKYFESQELPKDYFQFNKVVLKGTNGKCDAANIRVYQTEEANTEVLLQDENYKPSFEWRETFCTLMNNKVKIYTDNKFSIKEAVLIYYRQPREIRFLNCVSLDTGIVYTLDQTCEFKDDITELIIDLAASIITGDLESIQTQRLAGQVEKNN